jgi:long-chain acyl-CoA synthetase
MSDAAKAFPPLATGESLPGLVLARALAQPARTILRAKRLGIWKQTTGAELSRAIADCAAGLRTLGLKPGETAGILAAPSPEWLIADLAIQSSGAISAGFHAEAAHGELAAIIARSGTKILFVDTAAALDAALDLCEFCVGLAHIVCLDAVAVQEAADPRVLAFDALIAKGAASAGRSDAPWTALAGDALAAILPTSGLSGPSRAAQFAHAALRAGVDAALSIADLREGDERLSLMPASHAFERVFGFYAALAAGVTVNFPESAETALANLRELQPQIVSGPPALWSGIARSLAAASAGATKFQHNMFERAMSGGGLAGGFVLRKVRQDIGLGRVRVALSAGAPLSSDVRSRISALGVDITDVYAVAEAAGAVATSVTGGRDFVLARGAAAEIGPDGQLHLRTAALCAGFAAEGARAGDWLESGDIADPRAGGFALVGARESTFGAAAARHSAWTIEDALAASPYILASVVSGDAREKLTAVVFADYENVVRYAQARATPFTHYKSLIEAADIRALFEQEVARINATVAPARIVDFIVADRTVGPGDPELGPALNLRRRIVVKAFSGRGS